MNLYEHTIIARQDTSPSEIEQLKEKYSKIVEKNEGGIVKTRSFDSETRRFRDEEDAREERLYRNE